VAERIVLVGAGDHGRGVLEILRRMQSAGSANEVIGFVDDSPTAQAVDGIPVLGSTGWLVQNGQRLDAAVIIALASPAAKKRIAQLLGEAGVRFASAVHPRADLAPSVTLERGSVINSGVAVVYDTRIGAHVTINLNATVGHHVHIGDYATIAPGANILGKVELGEGCMVHANAVVLPSIRIGKGAVVGAGSVVIADVAPDTTVFGNPARVVPVRH
jgi:sugar O-acyltransferase (sialic acid O-acetyltransferase NeuD family)